MGICDKGCSMTVTRREYQNSNCFRHLANEVTKLRYELSEINRQKEHVENSNRQKQEIAELCTDILMGEPPKWQQKHNMKIGTMNLLERVDFFGPTFVQSAYNLTARQSCFKIYVISPDHIGLIRIGLTRRGYFDECLESKVEKDFSKRFNDMIDANPCLHEVQCKSGYVVECGVEFPKDFSNNNNHSAEVYICVNQKLEYKATHAIPDGGFFPTIVFNWSNTKVRYCQK